MSFPIQWYHSHADPIWQDGTFERFHKFNWGRESTTSGARNNIYHIVFILMTVLFKREVE
jgi:hypothetical protein